MHVIRDIHKNKNNNNNNNNKFLYLLRNTVFKDRIKFMEQALSFVHNIVQLVKKFPALYAIQIFITLFFKTRYCTFEGKVKGKAHPTTGHEGPEEE